jgi:hypothetical protein
MTSSDESFLDRYLRHSTPRHFTDAELAVWKRHLDTAVSRSAEAWAEAAERSEAITALMRRLNDEIRERSFNAKSELAAAEEKARRAMEVARLADERRKASWSFARGQIAAAERRAEEARHRADGFAAQVANSHTSSLSLDVDPFGFYVYCLWAEGENSPFYVGQSRNIFGRLGQHVQRFGRRLARVTVTACPDEEAARRIEGELIRQFRPVENIILNKVP